MLRKDASVHLTRLRGATKGKRGRVCVCAREREQKNVRTIKNEQLSSVFPENVDKVLLIITFSKWILA